MDKFYNNELKNIFIKLFKKTYLIEFDDGKYIVLPTKKNNKKYAESMLEHYMSEEIYLSEHIDDNLSTNKTRKYEQDVHKLQQKVSTYKQPSNFSCFHDSPSSKYLQLFTDSKVIYLSSGEDAEPYIEIIYNVLIEIFNKSVLERFNKKNNAANNADLHKGYIYTINLFFENYLIKKRSYFILSSLYSNSVVWLKYNDYLSFVGYAYKTKSHFILWFSIRYYFNHTLSLQTIPESYHYFRIMESLYYSIVNIEMFKKDKKHAMFYSCIDIFSHLNFQIDNIGASSKKTYYEFMKIRYNNELDILSQEINANYNNLDELDTILKLDMLGMDENTSKYRYNFLEFANIDDILEPFRKYLEDKLLAILPSDVQMTNNGDEQQFCLISNIFATDNPNRYDFWKGVRLYSNKIPPSRNTLLLIDMHKAIRLNFIHIEPNKQGNYFILLYDLKNDSNRYVIDCQNLKDRNIKFIWYDIDNDKFIPLYGIFTPTNAKHEECKYECECDNQNISGEYNPLLRSFRIFYKNKTFEFINYDKYIESDPEYSNDIKPVLSSTSDTNAQYSLASITLKAGTMNASSQISTISPSGAVTIKLTVKITDGTYLPPYELATYSYYMYLCKTSELIEGEIKEEDNKILLEFLINKEKIKSNLHAGFSISKQRLLNAHKKDSKCNDTKQLNYKKISNNLYEGDISLNIGDLPLIIRIHKVLLISRYKNIIKLSAEYKTVGIEVLEVNKEKCIRWGYIECLANEYEDKKISSIINNGKIHLLTKTNSDTEAIYGTNISIVRDEWSQENLLKNNSSVLIFSFAVSIKAIYDNKTIDISYINKEDIQSYIILGRQALPTYSYNVISMNKYPVYKDDGKEILPDKIELEAVHKNFPDEKNVVTYWGYGLSDKLNNSDISLKIDKFHVSDITVSASGTCLAANMLSTSSSNISNQHIGNNKIYQLPLYGRIVEINYQEIWFGKYVHFFPYSKAPESSISEVWHIEQPISLKFNGEKLQIIEDGNIIEEYEARSGIAIKKRADANNDTTQEVPYPDKSKDTYFYYNEQSANNIAEGEYYIIEEALDANSTELVGELYSGLYKNTLGNRYVELYKSSDVIFSDIEHFNQMLLERKNYFFKSDTRNKIHGGKDYNDKGGIDLSENADNFFENLTKLIKDKPLYKVYGKVVIKLEVKYSNTLILNILRICEFRPENIHGKYWATIGRFELRQGNKIVKNIYGQEIKGYMIEPASFNKNSGIQADYQQITAGTDTCVQTGQYKIFWRTSSKFYFLVSENKQLKELVNSLGIEYEKDMVWIIPEIYNEKYGISANTKIYGNEGQNRSAILIHSGVGGKNTTGCLIPKYNLMNYVNDSIYSIGEYNHDAPEVSDLFYEIIKHDEIAFTKYNQKYFVNNFFINIENDNDVKIYKKIDDMNEFLKSIK